MLKNLFKYTLIALFLSNFSYAQNNLGEILTAAQQPNLYLPLLKNKRVGVVTNQTGVTDGTKIIGKKSCDENTGMGSCAIFEQISIVDFLLENEIDEIGRASCRERVE